MDWIMVDEQDRNRDGEFTETVTDEEVLQAVQKNEPAGTNEVAEDLGIARQSADYRLRNLLDDGRVTKKKIGHTLVWSVRSD